MDEHTREQIFEAARDAAEHAASEPGLEWSLALSSAIIRALEKKIPGFRSDVRQELVEAADRMEASDEDELREDAPSVRQLADSWIFTA